MDELNSRYWAGRRLSRRTVLRGAGLAGAGLTAAALIGCGGDDDPDATAAPTQDGGTGTATATATATEMVSDVKTGGRLQLHQVGDPPSFDLHKESTTYTNYVTGMGYNQLVKIDPLDAQEAPTSVVGDLATEWEIAPDGQTYTFHVVPNAKFADGTPFTAADVKASYERQLNPPEGLVNPPRGAQIQWIGSIDTPDDTTVVMNMNRPVSSLSVLPILGQGWMAIYSQKDIEGGFDFKKEINGTGAYRLNAYEPGARISWDKNPEYFVPDRPYLDGVDVFVVPDASTALANFQGGQLHVTSPNVQDLKNLQAAMGDKIVTQPTQGYGFSTMNYGGHEPWTDARVRQAVAMALNKQEGIDVVTFGDARFGGYLSGGGYWSLSEADLATIPGYEPFTDSTIAESRKLLDAAGVPASIDAQILTRLGSGENLSLYIQDQLAKVGIVCTLDIQETATAYDNFSKRTFDLGPWGHAYAVDDPDAVFAEFYTTTSPRNYSQVFDAGIDDLYLQQSQEQDPEARREMVRELQMVAMPLHGKTIVYWSNARETTWSTVKNYVSHNSIYNNRRWQDVWLDV